MKCKELRTLFPIGSRTCQVQYQPPEKYYDKDELEVDFSNVKIRLVLWLVDEHGWRTVSGIYEKNVDFIGDKGRYTDTARLDNLILAWIVVVDDVLKHLDHVTFIGDLIPKSNPLWLLTAHTADDFERAYRMKSRLGKYLP